MWLCLSSLNRQNARLVIWIKEFKPPLRLKNKKKEIILILYFINNPSERDITLSFFLGVDNIGIIYMLKNIKNDKRYIGQTKQDIQKRFRQHVEAAYLENRVTYNNCLSRAIRKYGADSFHIGIIADNVPEEDLDLVEAHYIDMYNTIAPNGYNMSPGFNDNREAHSLLELTPDDNYEEHHRVIIDDISEDDVDKFLRDL